MFIAFIFAVDLDVMYAPVYPAALLINKQVLPKQVLSTLCCANKQKLLFCEVNGAYMCCPCKGYELLVILAEICCYARVVGHICATRIQSMSCC